jgi:FKBP-type peptidyl-prolyl cis-trans isomerase SlyD
MSKTSIEQTDSPAIEAHHWVRVKYQLFSFQGELLEENFRELTYLHGGFGDVLPKIEEALAGHHVGYSVVLHLEPDDAFGDYDAALINQIDRAELPMDIEVGMSIEGLPDTENDGVIYTVTDLTDQIAIVDGNHPLAGLGVRFDIEVLDVQAATQVEIEEFETSGIVPEFGQTPGDPTDDWPLQQTVPGSGGLH